MKLLIVHMGLVCEYPPVINLIQNLLSHKHEIYLVSYDCDCLPLYILQNPSVHTHTLPVRSYSGFLSGTIDLIRERIKLKKIVREYMCLCEVIWTTTDKTARDIGRPLLNYKHVMQLMELVEYIPLLGQQKIIKADIAKYARAAYKVVVPEYNRAHIQKAWWGLKEVPTILPNKPYTLAMGGETPQEVKQALDIISKIGDKKIILYQGVYANDRNLDIYAQAIDEMQEEYCFCIMGKENDLSKQLMMKYTSIISLPFITPPYHLNITSKAYIGLLPYRATKKSGNNSVLNGLFCAPNKIYEYGAFGIPMLGSDVPGLKPIFEKYKIGICCENNLEKVIMAIKQIELEYKNMKKCCEIFYEDTDLDSIVDKILKE